MKRPFPLWILFLWLIFLAFGSLYGGIAMLLDPSGALLGLDTILSLLPVPDSILPGLFLLLVMGLAPFVLAFGLFACPNWPWADALARWSGHYWPWAGTLALGIVLLTLAGGAGRHDWRNPLSGGYVYARLGLLEGRSAMKISIMRRKAAYLGAAIR